MTVAYIIAAFSLRPHATMAFSSRSATTVASFLSRNASPIMTSYKPSHLKMSSSAPSSSSSSSSSTDAYIRKGISRIETLQTLLSLHGAPGSSGCTQADGDLEALPIVPFAQLVEDSKDILDLHPHLYPIAKSKATGNYICALRRPNSSGGESNEIDNDENPSGPLAIVEGGIGLPGMKLLSLNSELLMRRIAAEADFSGGEEGQFIVDTYNKGLGEGNLMDPGLDIVYEPGSVENLGYGAEKYVLLRVGPFPDLYEAMSMQHVARQDESSALIAAEASNGKFTGFGSTFAFYAKLLSTFPSREEETKDAARVCLRLPLSSVAMTAEELAEVGRYAGLGTNEDSVQVCLQKMQEMYEKIRKHEQEENSDSGKTAEQIALDEANYMLDTAALTGKKWSEIRAELAEVYDDAGKENMAKFVNPSSN